MATKPPAPSDLLDKFMLRLPDGMRDQIAEVAKKNGRSMNSEIVQRLKDSLLGDAIVEMEQNPPFSQVPDAVKAMRPADLAAHALKELRLNTKKLHHAFSQIDGLTGAEKISELVRMLENKPAPQDPILHEALKGLGVKFADE